ncbi:AI-2E family transporter [Crenalkalicoccus roseus]|uniref:AI-2E family transporter n=1 Tax=Crenalkalicoccus roseus TaxID=1485588 RepID=UPI001081FD49|nr:AI-2E family transporter [Crenalkalicoccus roseus]
MSRSAVSALVLAACLGLLLVLAPQIPLALFGAAMLAVVWRTAGAAIARRTGLGEGMATAGVMALVGLALAAGLVFGAAMLVEQWSDLMRLLPRGLEAVRELLAGLPGGEALLGAAEDFLREGPEDAAGVLARLGLGTANALLAVLLVLVASVYLAAMPGLYQAGLVRLFAPPLREEARIALGAGGRALRGWLWAKGVSMLVIFLGVWAGLTLIGMPNAFALAVIAGLFEFVPYVGAIASAVPALLVALAAGGDMVLWVLALYLAVQAIEANVVEPLAQYAGARVPPVLVLASQTLMGLLFGLPGIILATPLVATLLGIIRCSYVERWLEAPEPPPPA